MCMWNTDLCHSCVFHNIRMPKDISDSGLGWLSARLFCQSLQYSQLTLFLFLPNCPMMFYSYTLCLGFARAHLVYFKNAEYWENLPHLPASCSTLLQSFYVKDFRCIDFWLSSGGFLMNAISNHFLAQLKSLIKEWTCFFILKIFHDFIHVHPVSSPTTCMPRLM